MNDMTTLRDHLFAVLQAARDKDSPMDVDRIRAAADVGRVLVDTAKVEVEYLKVTGSNQGSGFIPAAPEDGDAALSGGKTATGVKMVAGNVTTHRLR